MLTVLAISTIPADFPMMHARNAQADRTPYTEYRYLQPQDSVSLKNLSDFGEFSWVVLHFHQSQELLDEHLAPMDTMMVLVKKQTTEPRRTPDVSVSLVGEKAAAA